MPTSGRCLPPYLPLPRPSSVASGHGWTRVAGRTIEAPTPGRTIIRVPMAGRTIKVSLTGPAIAVPTAGRIMGNGPYVGQTECIITAAKATATVAVTVTGTSGSLAGSP